MQEGVGGRVEEWDTSGKEAIRPSLRLNLYSPRLFFLDLVNSPQGSVLRERDSSRPMVTGCDEGWIVLPHLRSPVVEKDYERSKR